MKPAKSIPVMKIATLSLAIFLHLPVKAPVSTRWSLPVVGTVLSVFDSVASTIYIPVSLCKSVRYS